MSWLAKLFEMPPVESDPLDGDDLALYGVEEPEPVLDVSPEEYAEVIRLRDSERVPEPVQQKIPLVPLRYVERPSFNHLVGCFVCWVGEDAYTGGTADEAMSRALAALAADFMIHGQITLSLVPRHYN